MRIVSVWLKKWPILRFLSAQARGASQHTPVNPTRPFALSVNAPGGPRIAALNTAAEAGGLRCGDLLADAHAKAGFLQTHPADPEADRAALCRLACWATRYTPAVAPWDGGSGTDGLFLDVTGASHLFGGEEGLLADLACRLRAFNLTPQLAIADTAGAAWAMSHFHSSPAIVLRSGEENTALAPLPIEALRLRPEMCAALRRLGFKRVGAVLDKPRAPFTARFSAELLRRLDQALGRIPEPLAFVAPVTTYRGLRQLLEPITTQDAIVTVADLLMQDLVPALIQDGMGARRLQLTLYRVDGEVIHVDLSLSAPTRNPAHVAHLLHLKLERAKEAVDAGFGFEALSLTVTTPERMAPAQAELADHCVRGRIESTATLIDKLSQRLGPERVRRLEPRKRHLPEKAEASCHPAASPVWPMPDEARPRPILLLPCAEPAEVVALVPEGPPKRFRWRGINHDVVRSQGPERIASEWWRHRRGQPTRDYYVAEDNTGRRFWLCREGLYGRETSGPRWFVHGLFA